MQIADSFKTLRDMGGANDIRPADLKVLKRLGAGAFAVVESALYSPEGTAPGEGRMVVVKRLKPEIVKHELDLANFINEVALLRKLSHKRVVEYIGAGCTDNSSEDTRRQSMFLVQELMDGGTLKQLVQRQMVDVHSCVYTMADAFRLGIHVAEGLAYLHNARPVVVHRDIKLENILLKGKDPHTAEAKIADFGLVALVRPKERGPASTLAGAGLARVQRSMTSKRLRAQRSNSLSVEEAWTMSVKAREVQGDKSALTPQNLSGRTGSFMYMAPEVYRQEPYTEKVDVFSFGVILFELLSRYQMLCAVSVAGTPEEVENYAAKVSEGYRPPIPEHWPESVRQLIGECWHQDPALRPPMARVRERLAAMVQDGTAADMELQTRPPACGCTIC